MRVPTISAEVKAETSYVLYDAKFRPIRSYTTNYLGGFTCTDSKLDAFSGQLQYTLQKHKRTSGDAELTVKEAFTYSAQNRLLTHTHQINGGAEQLLADNTYDELGKLTSKKVGNTSALPLQNVNYTYNVRGWLTQINEIKALQKGTDPKDLFGFKLNYNTVDGSTGAADKLYNGNIAETFWSTATDGGFVRNYGYKYDSLNRLKDASYQRPGFSNAVPKSYDENLTYDKNGNIMTLKRNGDADDQLNLFTIDDLSYEYLANSNKLMRVSEAQITATSGFKDGNTTGDDYDYDDNGNLIKDKNKNITTAITYNHLNLPIKIIFPTGNIVYIYTASGQKMQKIVTEGASTTTTDYLGGYQYQNTVLQFFPTAEGYVKNTANVYSYVFNYTDHLGNVRLSYNKNPSTNSLTILEENSYYPFGMKHTLSNAVVQGQDYKYKYNGKELQDELGLNMYDYGARNYDPALGRWGNIDNMSEKYHSNSPYVYANNNPIIYIDLDGNEWFYHSTDGKSDPTWNWHDGDKYKTGVKDSNGKEVVLDGVEAVVSFKGSRDEKLGEKDGKDGYINGKGAKTATVTVYGPDGKDDVHTFTGYTMSSNSKKFGAIDEGTYDGNFDIVGKSGALKSNWAIENRGRVRMLDGSINPYSTSSVDRNGEGYKTGIFIHTSNQSGFAGEIHNGTSGISVGCLLISPNDWKEFNNVMSGVKNFKVEVQRTVKVGKTTTLKKD